VNKRVNLPVVESDDFLRGYSVAYFINIVKIPLPVLSDIYSAPYIGGGWASYAERTGHRRSILEDPEAGFLALSAPVFPTDNGTAVLELDLGGTVIEHDLGPHSQVLAAQWDISNASIYRAEWQRILRAQLYLNSCCYRAIADAHQIAFHNTSASDDSIVQLRPYMWVCTRHQYLMNADPNITIASLADLANVWGYEVSFGGSTGIISERYWLLQKLPLGSLRSRLPYNGNFRELSKMLIIVLGTIQAATSIAWFLSGVMPHKKPATAALWLYQIRNKADLTFYILLIGFCIVEALITLRIPQKTTYTRLLNQYFCITASAIIINTICSIAGSGISQAHNAGFYPLSLVNFDIILFLCIGISTIILHRAPMRNYFIYWSIFFALSTAFIGIALYA